MPVFSLDRKRATAWKPWGYSRARMDSNLYGVDGILTIGASFGSTVDGPTVYKEFTSMYIPAGAVVTTKNRCKGLVIKCLGDCVIDGTLSMTARGCRGEGEVFAPLGIDEVHTISGVMDLSIGADGGSGGARRYGTGSGLNGSSGENAACGGGGSGSSSDAGASSTIHSGAGSAGTTWSGGTGGGGMYEKHTVTGQGENGAINGGKGGDGHADYRFRAGGGAGNPGGSGSSGGSSGQSGTGGLLVLIVEGALIINGVIESKGSRGGSGHGNGGSSGGGTITIIHGGDYINNGIVTVAGGPRTGDGGAGGSGSIRTQKGWTW